MQLASDTRSIARDELLVALAEIEREDPALHDEDGPFRLSELVDGTFAVGRCRSASFAVARLLQERGIDAWPSCRPHELMPPPAPMPGRDVTDHLPVQLGLGNASGGFARHVSILCLVDGALTAVDYTATQYGLAQWPFIARVPQPVAP